MRPENLNVSRSGAERNIEIQERQKLRDCAIITWRGGVGNPEGGHRGKSHIERGGLDVKFNIDLRGGGGVGALLFFTLFHKLEKW